MTKLTFLRKYGKKTGIGIAVGGTALLAAGLSLFFVGGLARPILIGDNNTNISYAQTSALNFQKESTFRALNNQFTENNMKLFNVSFESNGNIMVSTSIAYPNNDKVIISDVGGYINWVSSNSFTFKNYFDVRQAQINALPPSAAKDLLVNEYNFEYGITFGAVLDFQLFIAGAVLFPLGLMIGLAGIGLAIKSKNY